MINGTEPSNPPVHYRQRIAELLDTLVMGGVTRHQFQPLDDGGGGDHRVGPADGLAGAVEVAGDAARQLGGGYVERENLFGSGGRHEGVLPLELLGFLVATNDFKDG